MKRFIVVLTLLFLPVPAFAVSFQAGETLEVQGEGNAYAAGNIVQISTPTNGDVYLAGETIQINATVAKDAFLVGQTITINDSIKEDVHAFASTIIVNSDIQGDAILFGQKIVISPNAHIYGSVVIGGQEVQAHGTFEKDTRLMGAKIITNGTFMSDATMHVGETLSVNETAQIHGNLSLTVPEHADIRIPEGVIIGEVSKKFLSKGIHKKSLQIFSGIALVSFISRILLGVLVIILARLFAVHFGEIRKKNFWGIFGLGFLGFLAPPFIATILFFPVITIPLALLVLVLWGTLLYIASLLTGFLVANLFFPLKTTDSLLLLVGKFSLGTLIVAMLKTIPFFGFILSMILFLLSIGSVLRYEATSCSVLRKAKLL